MKRIKQQRAGFTLVELMIATTVFSVVLLLCTYGLLAVGRAYYKGLAISRTQENARVILADVAEAIKFSPGDVSSNGDSENSLFCIGTKQYITNITIESLQSDKLQLVSDNVPNCSEAGWQPLEDVDSLTDTSRNMLSPRMKLMYFDVKPLETDGLYKVTVSVGTGRVGDVLHDMSDMDFEIYADPESDEIKFQCRNERGISTFCTITELSTTVHRRV